MPCENHPQRAEAGLCTGCQDPYCDACLVSLNNERYCSNCKSMNINPAVFYEGIEKSEPEEAREALKYAVIGILCFGIILGPIAASKGFKALSIIKKDPFHQKGRTKAAFSILLGLSESVLWVLNIFSSIAAS